MLASGPVLGVLAGLALRGRLSRLAELRVRWWPVLGLAVALRLIAGGTGELAPILYMVAFGGIVAVALMNARIAGMAVIATGASLNLVVVAANGGMPVDAASLAAAGAKMADGPLHIPLGESTVLPLLADRIAVGLFRAVYSIGDVLLTVGGFWVPFASMRGR